MMRPSGYSHRATGGYGGLTAAAWNSLALALALGIHSYLKLKMDRSCCCTGLESFLKGMNLYLYLSNKLFMRGILLQIPSHSRMHVSMVNQALKGNKM